MEIVKSGNYLIKLPDVSRVLMHKIYQKFSYYNPKTENTKAGFLVLDDYLGMPRNIEKVKEIFGNDFSIKDKTISTPMKTKMILSDNFKLRPEQVVAVKEILAYFKTEDNSCILKAAPGFGKSFILPYIVNKVNTNTLIITDRTNLVAQMQGEFNTNCTEVDLTILNGSNRVPTGVTITTFQFLIRNEKFLVDYANFFFFFLVDEAHVVGSDVFTKVVGRFNAKYRLGLSATPTRSDYMTGLLLDVMGTRIVSASSEGNLKAHLVSCWHKASFFSFTGSYRKDYSTFLQRKDIMDDVIGTVKKLASLNRVGLIYITEVEAQEEYALFLNKAGISAGVINQKISQENRLSLMEAMEKDTLQIIVSGNILQKGISIKRLDYIINLSNLTKEAHEQLIGRLRRHHETKGKPMFIDFLFKGKLFDKSLDRRDLSKELAKRTEDIVSVLEFTKFQEKLKTRIGE